jgi:hypothetical protein
MGISPDVEITTSATQIVLSKAFHRKVMSTSTEEVRTKVDQMFRTVNADVIRWFYQEEKLIGTKFPTVQFLHKSRHKKIK